MAGAPPTQEESATQMDGPSQSPVAVEPPRAPWGRLVGIGPTVSFGVLELIDNQVTFGNANKNTEAGVRVDDPRISHHHCKLFVDPNGKLQLLDQSSNGTWWNNIRMGKGTLRTLASMDSIVLLNPMPEKKAEELSSDAPPRPGVLPRAINYQFMFIDNRPPPMPPPMPIAPMPMPALPAQPQLLRGTSFKGGLDSMQSGGPGKLEDYERLQELGRGSFAVVERVRHRASGVEYAMKVMEKRKLLKGAAGGNARKHYAELQEKVLSEARILKRVDHPGIVRFIDIFETDAELCLVMELVQGGELFDHLMAHGPFCEVDARAIMHQLLHALQYLHERKIVHRDLKPENILLQHAADGGSVPTVKIADFGLAKLTGTGNVAATFCGTPQYFAPEVLESRNSRRGYDAACDMWSVGVVLYILLCGSPPFDEGGGEAASSRSIFEQIKAGVGASHFSAGPWAHISAAAKQLIQLLLIVDPTRRLDVHAALGHGWMRGEIDVGSVAVLEAAGAARLATKSPIGDEIEDSDEEGEARDLVLPAGFAPPPKPPTGFLPLPPPTHANKRQRMGAAFVPFAAKPALQTAPAHPHALQAAPPPGAVAPTAADGAPGASGFGGGATGAGAPAPPGAAAAPPGVDAGGASAAAADGAPAHVAPLHSSKLAAAPGGKAGLGKSRGGKAEAAAAAARAKFGERPLESFFSNEAAKGC